MTYIEIEKGFKRLIDDLEVQIYKIKCFQAEVLKSYAEARHASFEAGQRDMDSRYKYPDETGH